MDLEPEIYSTSATARFSALLARDTLKIAESRGHIIPYYSEEIQEFERGVRTVKYRQEFETQGFQACLYDAGHVPGSSSVHLVKGNKSLFYTGDINTLQTELLDGADARPPQSDIQMVESTYFGRSHTPRKILEERFIESVKETIDLGGKAVIAAFSIGRTQEIMLILKKHGLRAYVDGMGVDVFRLLRRRPESVRDFRLLKKAYDNAEVVDPTDRKDILSEPSVIVTTSGMLEGGPVLTYIRHLYDDPKSAVLLTGYQVEGTGGRRLVDTGFIEVGGRTMHLRPRIEQYDFSAHCGDSELKELVDRFGKTGVEKIITVHGDNCAQFAEWVRAEYGIDAVAPQNGEVVYV
ncbi:MAG TPA: MBL fold metallo-hydrolase [Candidatus Methanoperedenaceae archaeon]|nr:MBL fold metallo-hydrolase [Candidatus Methanoperedenaceae archaeon]